MEEEGGGGGRRRKSREEEEEWGGGGDRGKGGTVFRDKSHLLHYYRWYIVRRKTIPIILVYNTPPAK